MNEWRLTYLLPLPRTSRNDDEHGEQPMWFRPGRYILTGQKTTRYLKDLPGHSRRTTSRTDLEADMVHLAVVHYDCLSS